MKSVEAIVETCLMEMNIPAHYVRNKALITRAINAALTAHDEAREHLGNLLAIIHGDGGHYQAEHGNEKATTDAIAKYYELRAKHDEALPGEWTVEAYGTHAISWRVKCGDDIIVSGLWQGEAKRIVAAHNSALRLLVDALRYYADSKDWHEIIAHGRIGTHTQDGESIMAFDKGEDDPYRFARQALQPYPTPQK